MIFQVSWAIDVEADTAEEAARIALAVQRDPDSIATCFCVETHPLNQGNSEVIDLHQKVHTFN